MQVLNISDADLIPFTEYGKFGFLDKYSEIIRGGKFEKSKFKTFENRYFVVKNGVNVAIEVVLENGKKVVKEIKE